jgi:hypothetical protein
LKCSLQLAVSLILSFDAPPNYTQELSEKEIAPFVEMEHKRSMKKEDGEGKFHAPSGVGAGGLNEGRARREELYQQFHGFSI